MSPDQWREFRLVVPDWWALYPGTALRGLRLYVAMVAQVR